MLENLKTLDVKWDILLGVGMVGGTISTYFGGWDTALTTLLTFMAIDWISGMLLAGVFKNSGKTVCGSLRSDIGFMGLSKKAMILFIVLVANQLDLATGTSFIRDAVIIAYSVNEAVSIIENAGQMGVPIPKALKNAIEVLKDATDSDMEDSEPDKRESDTI